MKEVYITLLITLLANIHNITLLINKSAHVNENEI